MQAGEEKGQSALIYLLLAGIETGMIAALIMLGYLGFASAWYRRSFWHVPNLLATTFFGDSALQPAFTTSTWAGIALHLLLYSLLGVVFALAIRQHEGRIIALIGVLFAVGWYYLTYGFLWEKINFLVPLYTHDRSMFVGHILYGSLLGRFPHYLRVLQGPLPSVAAETAMESKAGPTTPVN